MRQAAFALLMVLALSGCVSRSVQTFSGPARPETEIAIVQGITVEQPDGKYFAHISGYADANVDTKFTFVGDGFIGYPSEVKILPGRYRFQIRCSQGNYFGFPGFTIQLAAGDMITVTCARAPGRSNYFQAIAQRVRRMGG